MEGWTKPPTSPARPPQPAEPMQGLRAVVALRRELDVLEARHVDAALQGGRSWSQIAEALGVSKQAAHKRHAQRTREAGAARPRPPPPSGGCS